MAGMTADPMWTRVEAVFLADGWHDVILGTFGPADSHSPGWLYFAGADSEEYLVPKEAIRATRLGPPLQ